MTIPDRLYPPSRFCLEYSINYCDGQPSADLRAVIDDAQLETVTASTIFGTNKEDSEVSKWLKWIGYPTSIIFLMITLVVFIVVRELRQVKETRDICSRGSKIPTDPFSVLEP